MGSKEKWWVSLPTDDREWLLKLARIDERDGTVAGEDWAEWSVHHLSGLMGVPTATVHPARLDGRRAIISRSVLHDRLDALDHGNSVISAKFPEYDQAVHGVNPGYTTSAVQEALTGVLPPREFVWPDYFTAFDVWVGYLLLDAWVAGRDRHHENWAVVLRGRERRLAPSFDHGNALGFQERDDRRQRMLQDDAHLQRWTARGTSRHFAGRPGLADLAHSALRLAPLNTREYWLSRLDEVTEQAVRSIISKVPADIMSEVTCTFIVRLLEMNQRRLLHGY